jgi:hypothetical protein
MIERPEDKKKLPRAESSPGDRKAPLSKDLYGQVLAQPVSKRHLVHNSESLTQQWLPGHCGEPIRGLDRNDFIRIRFPCGQCSDVACTCEWSVRSASSRVDNEADADCESCTASYKVRMSGSVGGVVIGIEQKGKGPKHDSYEYWVFHESNPDAPPAECGT